MSYQADIQNAQRVYKDILNGYSFFTYKSDTLYIKHLSDLDHGWIQEYRKICFEEVKKKGVQTENQQIESLIEQGLWSKDNEKQIPLLKNEVSLLYETKSKLKLKSQKKNAENNIKRVEKKLEELEQERFELIGITCENYSDKKVNERYLFYTCFKDAELKERLFSEEEFEYLEPSDLQDLVTENNKTLSDLGAESIKGIAACPFFLNNIMLCKNNPTIFFGKPVVKLTNYQTELFSTGLRWKRIIESSKSTPPMVESLADLVKWYQQEAISQTEGEEAKDIHSGARGVASSIVGADKEELESMAGESTQPGVSLSEEAKKLGLGKSKKILSMDDMLKIHGEV